MAQGSGEAVSICQPSPVQSGAALRMKSVGRGFWALGLWGWGVPGKDQAAIF